MNTLGRVSTLALILLSSHEPNRCLSAPTFWCRGLCILHANSLWATNFPDTSANASIAKEDVWCEEAPHSANTVWAQRLVGVCSSAISLPLSCWRFFFLFLDTFALIRSTQELQSLGLSNPRFLKVCGCVLC